MNECKFFCDQLSDYLDGEVADDECRFLEDHLAHCPPCAHLYESLKKTVVLCKEAVSDEIPVDVRESLKEFLRNHCPKCNIM
jgi:anti-sigma factor RsiW